MTIILLAGAGILGGAVNAIAGGGTFFTFPAMMAAGLDPLTANASNAVAIYPGHAAAIGAYKSEIRASGRTLLRRAAIMLVGGLLGAALLLRAGNATFSALVPWLLIVATLIFAGGPALNRLISKRQTNSVVFASTLEFIFAVYGGYFGAGLGVLLMAALTIVGVRDPQIANAQKNLLATVITTVSVLVFISAGAVAWPETLVVLFGAVIGGFGGGKLARHMSASVLRTIVICVGIGLSAYYFMK